MSDRRARVIYLGHSGFLIETVGNVLVFDYYMNEPRPGAKGLAGGVVTADALAALGKPIYVFVSHAHADHFNPVIYGWKRPDLRIRYIVSSDVDWREDNHRLGPGERFSDGDIRVHAFDSTDEGVSFRVEADGFSFFHAGDLNWWHWRSQSTPEEIYESERAFHAAVAPLAGEPVDVAFFPVDPRMGEYYYAGASYYIEEVKPRVFFPMHFQEEYEITDHFARLGRSRHTQVMQVAQRGQEFWVDAYAR